MMDDIWALLVSFLSGPETNTLAQAFAGIMTLVIGWRFIPIVLATVPALKGREGGRGTLRGVLAFVLSIMLGLAMAGAVGMLAQRA